MINNLLTKIATIIGAILAIFTVGNFYGKNSQKSKTLENDINQALNSKNRQNRRKSDDIATIRKRMQNYVRK